MYTLNGNQLIKNNKLLEGNAQREDTKLTRMEKKLGINNKRPDHQVLLLYTSGVQ